MTERFVVVHAHPDDETLWTGALIAASAADGAPVAVVTCNRGERGEVIALPGTTSEGMAHLEGDGPGLAAWRERELAAALDALGPGIEHTFLDALPDDDGAPASSRYEDSGMVWVSPGVAGPDPAVPGGFARVPLDEAAGRLAGFLRRTAATVVVTYEADGGYGHPDHVRAHQVTARAVELLGDEAPEFWQVLSDQSDAERADVSVPVEPVLDKVLAAMRAHATQVQGAVRLAAEDAEPGVVGQFALSNDVVQQIRACERYAIAAPVGSAR